MSEKVNIKRTLQAFNKIISHGERKGDEYNMNGLTASTDFDGYTITIKNDYVRLDVFFHNKFSFEYSNNKEREIFLDKIDNMSVK